jgi:leucine dehydrogenase
MTYKSALAATELGGGKAVVIGDPSLGKSAALLRAMGRFVHALDGLYIAAEDVGTTEDDMAIIRQETPYVTGLSRVHGSSGNPAWFTAFGVFLGIRLCLERVLRTDCLTGIRVAVQGCGNVASHLCQLLHDAEAELIVADVVAAKAYRLSERYGARVVAPDMIHRVPCEVYAPCALGGTLNDLTIPQLACMIVAGSANNQCLRPDHSDLLRACGILYAPDFVINAGGIINIAVELEPTGYDEARAVARIRHITSVLHEIFDLATHQQIATERAAILLAERKLAAAREAKKKEA